MSITNLGFRDLRYVIAVAEYGSVSRAAVACAISQPALSERIRRIEKTLGVELFERTKRTVRVTATGEQLVLEARQLLDDAIQIDETLSSAREPLAGPLHLGIVTTLGPYLMPHVLPPLRRRYPNLELVLSEGLTDTLIATLQSGSLDVVISAAPLRADGINQVELFDEPFVLAAPKDHEMAHKKIVSASDLCGDDMVLLEDGHCLSGQALDVCPAKHRQNRKRLHATTLETLRHMVATGAGYTLLPALAVGTRPPLSKLIRYRKLGGKRQYGRQIVLAWRKSFGRQADIDHLVDAVRSSLPTSYGVVLS